MIGGVVYIEQKEVSKMLKHYTRVNVLLPIKSETIKVFKGIVKRFCQDFGGVSYTKPHVSSQIEGVWVDDKTGEVIRDQHISLYIDVDLSKGINLEKYFSKFKKKYEKLLKESEIWIMSQRAVRVV